MIKIYSKKYPDELLHMVIKPTECVENRTDIIDVENFLQLAIINLNDGDSFKAHQHIWKEGKNRVIAQESWICIKGKVKCFYYDIDGSPLCEQFIEAGEISVTLAGGHNYQAWEDHTLVAEYKTGPYSGIEKDKIFI